MLALTLEWVRISVRRAGWAPISVFSTHMVASRGFGAYAVAPDLDIPMHVVGGVAIAYFLFHALGLRQAASLLGVLTEIGRYFAAFVAVLAATVVWEFAEWTTDRIGLTAAQGGLGDTMLDMALGAAGGAVYLGASWVLRARRGQGPTADG